MARTLQKTLLGFLSTAIFFAAFFLIGDVLIAAFTAFIAAVVQFVLSRTTSGSPGVAFLASLAIVIALTGLSLRGEDSFAAVDASQASALQNCHCSAQKTSRPARAKLVPFREIPGAQAPKALAPEDGRV